MDIHVHNPMYQEGFSHLYQLEEVFKVFLVIHSDLTIFLDDPIVLYLRVVTEGGWEGQDDSGRGAVEKTAHSIFCTCTSEMSQYTCT